MHKLLYGILALCVLYVIYSLGSKALSELTVLRGLMWFMFTAVLLGVFVKLINRMVGIAPEMGIRQELKKTVGFINGHRDDED